MNQSNDPSINSINRKEQCSEDSGAERCRQCKINLFYLKKRNVIPFELEIHLSIQYIQFNRFKLLSLFMVWECRELSYYGIIEQTIEAILCDIWKCETNWSKYSMAYWCSSYKQWQLYFVHRPISVVHCTNYTATCTLYTLQFNLYAVLFTMCPVQCTL